jgi:hypothetical protein
MNSTRPNTNIVLIFAAPTLFDTISQAREARTAHLLIFKGVR